MPGQSKVNGTWRTTAGLSVKVGGQWKTATSAFVKVGGVWKQWFASKVQDAFNRASTVTGLGTADSGQVWTALRGNWRISGSNSALSDDAASSYPIASVNLGNTDISAQADVSGGTGAAFWITDSGSWWATYPQYTQSTSAIVGSCTTTASSSYYYSTWNTTVTGSACTGSQSYGSSSPCAGGGTGCLPSGCCSPVTSVLGTSTCSNFQNDVLLSQCASGCGSTFNRSVTTYVSGTSCNYENTALAWSGTPPSNCCTGTVYNQQTQTNTSYSIAACGTQCSGSVSSTSYSISACGTQCSGSVVTGTTYLHPECGTQCSGSVTVGGGSVSYYPAENPTYGGEGCAPGDTTVSNSSSSQCIQNPAFVCCRTTSGTELSCAGNCQTTSTSCASNCSTTTTQCANNCVTSTTTTGKCIANLITTSTPVVTNYYNCHTQVTTTPTTYYCGTTQATSSCSGSASCTGFNCYTGGACGGLNQNQIGTTSSCSGGQATCSGAGCTPSGCCSGVSYSGGDTTYHTDLVIVSSVSGSVVSQSATRLATNTNSGYTSVGSLIVSTVGNQITAKAYASAGLTSQLGSNIVITPTSPTKGTSVGIIKAPSPGSQGSTLDNFLGTI